MVDINFAYHSNVLVDGGRWQWPAAFEFHFELKLSNNVQPELSAGQ